jgi:hypothetical protein
MPIFLSLVHRYLLISKPIRNSQKDAPSHPSVLSYPFAEHLSGIIKEILIKDLGKLATLDLLHKFFCLQNDHLNLLIYL